MGSGQVVGPVTRTTTVAAVVGPDGQTVIEPESTIISHVDWILEEHRSDPHTEHSIWIKRIQAGGIYDFGVSVDVHCETFTAHQGIFGQILLKNPCDLCTK